MKGGSGLKEYRGGEHQVGGRVSYLGTETPRAFRKISMKWWVIHRRKLEKACETEQRSLDLFWCGDGQHINIVHNRFPSGPPSGGWFGEPPRNGEIGRGVRKKSRKVIKAG